MLKIHIGAIHHLRVRSLAQGIHRAGHILMVAGVDLAQDILKIRGFALFLQLAQAALGAGLPIDEAYGTMIVDISAGVTDIAVLSFGKVIVSDCIKVGGDRFDDAIIRHLRRKHNLLIGERTAEELKINIGSVIPRSEQLYMEVTGRNLITGLPKTMRITSDDVTEALDDPLQQLIEESTAC